MSFSSGVCSIVLILAVLCRDFIALLRNSIKAGVNWHKILEIEHTPDFAEDVSILSKIKTRKLI